MLIIVGHNFQTKKDYGPTLPTQCPHCHNDTFYSFMHIKLWITLYFIPVLPYVSDFHLQCRICGYGRKLAGEEIEIAKKLNKATGAFVKMKISKEQYAAVLKEARISSGVMELISLWSNRSLNLTRINA